jgi:hypothetical protein
MPTLSQAVLEYAGLTNSSPEVVRSGNAVPVGNYVDAGNPSRPPAVPCIGTTSTPCVDPLNPFTLPVDPSVLSTLRPLAFTGATKSTGTATPTQLFDPDANMFVYAVGGLSLANKGSSQPDTLLMFYDDPSRMFYDDPSRTKAFQQNQTAAKIALPLTVLNSDGTTERFVPAVLQFKVPAAGKPPCSASTVTGDFAGTGHNQTLNLNNANQQIGVNCAVIFAKSPVSPETQHAIFEVTASLLITSSTDPAIIFVSNVFKADDPGFTPAKCPGKDCILGYNKTTGIGGKSIGVAPSAGPLGSPSATTSATYALCASVPTDAGGQTLLPSAAAFYVIAADSEVFLSAPLAPPPLSNGRPGIVCPVLNGGPESD